MKAKQTVIIVTALILLMIQNGRAISTGFTYQGRLTDAGNLPNNVYDLSVTLWSTPIGTGGQVGNPVVLVDVPVTNGLFTVTLNAAGEFGANAFDGSDRWLEISVRPGTDTGPYTLLLPRQPITPTPYAIRAGDAGTLGGQSPAAYVAKAGDTMTGTLDLPQLSVFSQTSGARVGRFVQTSSATSGIGALQAVSAQSTGSALDVGHWYGSAENWAFRAFGNAGRSENANVSDTGSVFLFGVRADGNVGIGTFDPGGKLSVYDGNLTLGGANSPWGATALMLNGNYASPDAGRIRFGDGTGWKFHFQSRSGDRDILTIRDDGNVGIGITSPAGSLHVRSGSGFNNPQAIIEQTTPGDYSRLQFRSGTSHPWDIAVADDANGGVMNFFRQDAGNLMTLDPSGTLAVKVLQINGADVAEPFALSTKGAPKGSLVVIDKENPGRLRISEQAYDKRVAGILSGANGVNSGVCLSQKGFNDGGENVALSGRVYALAIAFENPIEPGDPLTTSDTPGHCMKATDTSRSQGAVIGKAMSSLPNGKGTVLVLVSLQ